MRGRVVAVKHGALDRIVSLNVVELRASSAHVRVVAVPGAGARRGCEAWCAQLGGGRAHTWAEAAPMQLMITTQFAMSVMKAEGLWQVSRPRVALSEVLSFLSEVGLSRSVENHALPLPSRNSSGSSNGNGDLVLLLLPLCRVSLLVNGVS